MEKETCRIGSENYVALKKKEVEKMKFSTIQEFCSKHPKQKYIFLSVLGFLLTTLIAYPINMHWDSAYVFSRIYNTGHAELSCWMGWYFPVLWQYLYKLTHIETILGIYINAIYWIGITIIFISIFDVRKTKLLWYFFLAYFPGNLLFVLSIANNSLYFVTLLLGISFYLYYKNMKHKWYYLLLSALFIVQCIFIRREAIFMIFPLFVLILTIEIGQKLKICYAFILASIFTALCLLGLLKIEKKFTDKIKDYNSFKSIGCIAVYDLINMSYEKKKNLIPVKYLKDEYQSNPDSVVAGIPETIQRKGTQLDPYLNKILRQNIWTCPITRQEILPVYLHNFPLYVYHRLDFFSQYLYGRCQLFSWTQYAPAFGRFTPPVNRPTVVLGRIWSFSAPPILYYIAGIVFLIFGFRVKDIQNSFNRHCFLFIIVTSFLASGVTICSATALQIRYLAPLFLLIYISCVCLSYMLGFSIKREK